MFLHGGLCLVAWRGGEGGVCGCSGGVCVCSNWEACMVALGEHGWLLWGCVVALGGCAWLVWGGHAWLLWGHVWDTMRYGDTVNEWAVCILLECILV